MMKILRAAVGAVLLATPALAQAPTPAPAPQPAQAPTSQAGTWNGLSDRFQIDTGYFRVNANTVLRLNKSSGASDEVNFEDDLGVEPTANTFWVDGTWRVGRRHQLKLAFTKLNRTSPTANLDRTFTWNGKVYSAGLSATGTLATNMWSGYYRFALIRKDRFEVGPAVGVGYLKLTAGIKATGTVTLPGQPATTAQLNESGSYGTITGDVGGYVIAWPHKIVSVRGDFLYIIVKPGEAEASVTDGRLALDVYPWKHVGFGAQYKYNKFYYKRDIKESGLGGDLTYQGAQLYLSFLF